MTRVMPRLDGSVRSPLGGAAFSKPQHPLVHFGVEPGDPAKREPMIGLITLATVGIALLALASTGAGLLVKRALGPTDPGPAKIERSVNQ